ncbi:MAG: aldehyde dehydrogenase family protein [Planctomycetota bacterium]
MTLELKLLIGGEWRSAASGETFTTINPATEDVNARVALGGAADVDLAVHAARKAFDDPAWRRMPAAQRAKLVHKLGDLIDQHADLLSQCETKDTGKTLFDSRKIEIPMAAEVFRFYAGLCTKVHGETLPLYPDSFTCTLREPIGVVAAITPWNFPLLLASWKLAPALAMGNTIVLKPASLTPTTAVKFGEICLEAGLPPGVVNIVTGPGEAVGMGLVRHPGVDKVAFTGSTQVGRQIMAEAAHGIKRISLELGGKSPNVVFADADLDAAVRGAMTGIFYNKGEVCAAGSRLLVERSIHDQFMQRLVAKLDTIKVGDPLDKGTRMGPVISAAQLNSVLAYVASGKQEGARLAFGGERLPGKGFFMQPTVFDRASSTMRIAREEIFGPVLTTIPFEDFDKAVVEGNNTQYGLAAAIWTRDISKALRAARALRAGTVWVNTYNRYDPALPFGGFKESGFGRELGARAIDLYTETKTLWIDL